LPFTNQPGTGRHCERSINGAKKCTKKRDFLWFFVWRWIVVYSLWVFATIFSIWIFLVIKTFHTSHNFKRVTFTKLNFKVGKWLCPIDLTNGIPWNDLATYKSVSWTFRIARKIFVAYQKIMQTSAEKTSWPFLRAFTVAFVCISCCCICCM